MRPAYNMTSGKFAKESTPIRFVRSPTISADTVANHALGVLERNETEPRMMLMANMYKMKSACPRVGTCAIFPIGCLWRRPNRGASMNMALNLEAIRCGHGTNLSRERRIGRAKPRTMTMILGDNLSETHLI